MLYSRIAKKFRFEICPVFSSWDIYGNNVPTIAVTMFVGGSVGASVGGSVGAGS
jgi:hypothetical protein